MRRRQIKIQFYLSDEELAMVDQKARQCGLNRAAFLRVLISGKMPQPLPPAEYRKMMGEVSALKSELASLRDTLQKQGQRIEAAQVESIRQDVVQEMKGINAAVMRDLPFVSAM